MANEKMRAASDEDMTELVEVEELTGTYGYGLGRNKKHYGPGKNLKIPRGLALALGMVAATLPVSDPKSEPGTARTEITNANQPSGTPDAGNGTDEDDDESDELPKVAELEDHLAGIDDVAEVRAMQEKDNRKTAAPLYEKRIAELEHSDE